MLLTIRYYEHVCVSILICACSSKSRACIWKDTTSGSIIIYEYDNRLKCRKQNIESRNTLPRVPLLRIERCIYVNARILTQRAEEKTFNMECFKRTLNFKQGSHTLINTSLTLRCIE